MKRVLKQAFKNIRRSPYRALAVVLILVVSFFTTQVFSLALFSSQQVLSFYESKPQVIAFFEDDAGEATILELKQSLEAQDYVEEAVYVSKAEALQIYQEQNQDDPLLLEMVTADILPASLEVSSSNVAYLPQIRTQLVESPGVEEVVYYQDVVEQLRKWTSGLRTAGVLIVGYLVTTALLILMIITSIRVASKRNEIRVLRLLGASGWYIRGPYLIEAAIYGLLASVLSFAMMFGLLLYLTPTLTSFFGEIPVFPMDTQFLLILLGVTALGGVLLGMVSAFVASQRYSLV